MPLTTVGGSSPLLREVKFVPVGEHDAVGFEGKAHGMNRGPGGRYTTFSKKRPACREGGANAWPTTVHDTGPLPGEGDHVCGLSAYARTLVTLDLGEERRRKLVEVQETSALPRRARNYPREGTVAIQVHGGDGGSHPRVGEAASA